MPRTYVDNAYNRSVGRVGMEHGTAVISSSGGGGGGRSSSYSGGGGGYSTPSYSSYSSGGGGGYSSPSYSSGGSSSGRSYVDNSMNRSLGRVGLPVGSAVHSSSGNSSSYYNNSGSSSSGTYVDNPLNRSLGRVGLAHGTAVHSSSSGISSLNSSKGSNGGTYVDNPLNRSLGRVGLPHGSAVHSSGNTSSGGKSTSSISTSAFKDAKVYTDNAYNRRLGRVGLPLGSAVVTSSARLGGVTEGNNSVGGKTAEPRRYVDNPMNRRLERVGMIVGSQPVTKKTAQPSTTSASRQNDIFRPLVKIDPEDDNLGGILEEIMKLRQEIRMSNVKPDPERELQCEQAIGIVNRHEAALSIYQNNLKVPDWVRGGQIIPFESLELGEKLGGGGFGDVHTAFWERKIVAVKKLRVQRVSQAKKEEFQAEVKVFSQLNHEAIVKFFGACIVSPNLAIVMEFMGGGSLYDILHIEQRVLTTTQQEQMLTDCLEALKYLHRRNVTHRDIKSMNIMICDDFEHCKLGDFGLALKEETRASSSVADHSAAGTLPYMPPEVIEGRRLKLDELKCVDVYAMGIVFVEFLTRKKPFDKMNQHQIRKAILDGLRPNSEGIIDATLRRLLDITLSARPESRPTARTFLSKWEELKLARSLNRMSIVDVNTSNEAGISERNNGGLPSYLADVRNTSSLSSLSSRSSTNLTSTSSGSRNSSSSPRLSCPVCLENPKNMAFGCGHLVCETCLPQLTVCPQCRGSVQNPIRLYV